MSEEKTVTGILERIMKEEGLEGFLMGPTIKAECLKAECLIDHIQSKEDPHFQVLYKSEINDNNIIFEYCCNSYGLVPIEFKEGLDKDLLEKLKGVTTVRDLLKQEHYFSFLHKAISEELIFEMCVDDSGKIDYIDSNEEYQQYFNNSLKDLDNKKYANFESVIRRMLKIYKGEYKEFKKEMTK